MDIVTGVGVLDKAVAVLHAVAAEPRSLVDLQGATGLPRATAHRLAVALEKHGLLRRDGAGRFDLGPELAAWGRTASERYPLAALARPVLERLRDASGESRFRHHQPLREVVGIHRYLKRMLAAEQLAQALGRALRVRRRHIEGFS